MAVGQATSPAVRVSTPAGLVVGIPEGGRLVFGRGPDVDLTVAAGRGLSRRAGVISAAGRRRLDRQHQPDARAVHRGRRLPDPAAPDGGAAASRPAAGSCAPGMTLVGSRAMLDDGVPLRVMVAGRRRRTPCPRGRRPAGRRRTLLPLYLDPNTKLFLVALMWCRPWLVDPTAAHAAAADAGDRPGGARGHRRAPRAGAVRHRPGVPGPALGPGRRARQGAAAQDHRARAGPRATSGSPTRWWSGAAGARVITPADLARLDDPDWCSRQEDLWWTSAVSAAAGRRTLGAAPAADLERGGPPAPVARSPTCVCRPDQPGQEHLLPLVHRVVEGTLLVGGRPVAATGRPSRLMATVVPGPPAAAVHDERGVRVAEGLVHAEPGRRAGRGAAGRGRRLITRPRTGWRAGRDLRLGGAAGIAVPEPGADLQPAADQHDRGQAGEQDREPVVGPPRRVGPVRAAVAGALAHPRPGQLRGRRERRMRLAGPGADRAPPAPAPAATDGSVLPAGTGSAGSGRLRGGPRSAPPPGAAATAARRCPRTASWRRSARPAAPASAAGPGSRSRQRCQRVGQLGRQAGQVRRLGGQPDQHVHRSSRPGTARARSPRTAASSRARTRRWPGRLRVSRACSGAM